MKVSFRILCLIIVLAILPAGLADVSILSKTTVYADVLIQEDQAVFLLVPFYTKDIIETVEIEKIYNSKTQRSFYVNPSSFYFNPEEYKEDSTGWREYFFGLEVNGNAGRFDPTAVILRLNGEIANLELEHFVVSTAPSDGDLFFLSAPLSVPDFIEAPPIWTIGFSKKLEITRIYFSGGMEVVDVEIGGVIFKDGIVEKVFSPKDTVDILVHMEFLDGEKRWSSTYLTLVVEYLIEGEQDKKQLLLPHFNLNTYNSEKRQNQITEFVADNI